MSGTTVRVNVKQGKHGGLRGVEIRSICGLGRAFVKNCVKIHWVIQRHGTAPCRNLDPDNMENRKKMNKLSVQVRVLVMVAIAAAVIVVAMGAGRGTQLAKGREPFKV